MEFKPRALLAVALVSAFVFAPPAVLVQAKPPVSLSDGRAEEVGMSTQRLDKITSAFTKEINDKKLPGAVVIVARKGLVVYRNAFGLRDPRKSDPMGADTIFRIYSMTKPPGVPVEIGHFRNNRARPVQKPTGSAFGMSRPWQLVTPGLRSRRTATRSSVCKHVSCWG